MSSMLVFALTIFLSIQVFASDEPILADSASNYYGSVDVSSGDLKKQLHDILNNAHISQSQGADRIVKNCNKDDNHCYQHRSLGYDRAREYLFGFIHLEGDNQNTYSLLTTYCQTTLTNNDFNGSKELGPMHIPKNSVVNTEHSWPQSKFTGSFPKSMQKSDLHALFPTLSGVNSIRGNYPFGEVINVKKQACETSALGTDLESNQLQFEPNDIVKGNIARAIFYFSTRYNVKLDDKQEAYLREWNHLDPVDAEEKDRNELIFSLQFVRNPYVDKPELIDEIQDF